MLDLGSGDGRILIEAALKYDDIDCYGVEINPFLVKLSNKRIANLGLSNRIKIIRGNLFQTDLSKFDVITLYLTPKAIKMLYYKLKGMLKLGKKVITHNYPIPGLDPVLAEKVSVNGLIHKIYLYTEKSLI